MKKFISLLSAAAVAATVVVVPITASAEDVFTYDGSDMSGWTDPTDNRINASVITDENGDYTKITTSGNGSGRIFYNLPAEAQLSDNYVIEYDINMNKANGMGRYGQYNQLAFIASDAALDSANDYGEYASVIGSGNTASNSGQGYVTGVASSVTSIFGIKSSLINYDGTGLAPSSDDTGMQSGKWYRVQAAVSGDVTTVTIIDSEKTVYADAVEYTNSASKLAQIAVAVGRCDDNEGPGTVLIDNVRIYAGEADTLTTTGLRGEIPEYTVTFMNGEEEVATVGVLSGNTVASADIPAVPEKEGYIGSWVLEDGTAFNSSVVVTGDITVVAEYAASVDPVAKAATIVAENGELRISEKTAGAVFRFETKDIVPEGQEIKKAQLIVKAAPRSYKDADARFENTEIWTYKVGSSWNSSETTITGDDWNNLSKNDPINKQYTEKYPTPDSSDVPPYQTLKAIDVTSAIGSDGVAIFAFKTSTAREHAIDAVLTIATREAGSGEPEPTEAPATSEPASTVEGSFESKALAPSNDWSTDFAAVEGTGEVVLNHSNANPLAAGSVGVYEDKVNYRGKSIYALYDVLVNAGDKVTLQLYNKTDLGTTFTLTGNADGTATAAALVNKGDGVTVGNVVCGTWYRVLIEVPQINNEGATNTGDATYTIYRIDSADPTKASEVAVAKAGLTPRNLSGKAMTTLTFSAEGTPYIDNGVAFVTAGGLSLIETPATEAPAATSEPASTVEGSFESKALAPSNDWSTDFAAVEGTGVVVLNHSNANPLAAGSVNVYEDKVNYRGKSIYALYDVLVNAGDMIKLELYNKTDLGTTFTLTGNADGTATAAALVNKGDSVTVGNVVCGTWYRVLIEVPQINNEGATNTGDATYTIYRINSADPTKASEVAVAKAGLTPRNLSGKAMTTLTFSAEGTPYIDNGVVFVTAPGYELELKVEETVWRLYTAEKNADGELISVSSVIVDDPAAVTLGDNQYLWDQNQTPYK